MKKIFYSMLVVLLLVGCTLTSNTPTSKVDEFLGKYKDLDSEILDDIDFNTELTGLLNESQKKEYKKVLKRQYSNMIYDIKDEIIENDNAIVNVNVNVYDLYSVEKSSYEFRKNNSNVITSEEEYYNMLLKNMLETEERIDNIITINLVKRDNKWTIKELSTADKEKLHGMYDFEN